MQNSISLTENRDFKRAYAKGKTYAHPLVVVYAVRNRKKFNRIGITTSKKIGGAVQRNRARRVIREALRPLCPQLSQGYDIVLVARRKTVFVKTANVAAGLVAAFSKLGLLDGAGKSAGDQS